MHIHLDLVGGLSGDMFIGALLDCFADHGASLSRIIDDAGFHDLVVVSSAPVNDGTLTGTRFKVAASTDAHGHHHRHFSEIQRILTESSLPDDTRRHALGIFQLLAEAEAAIHGTTVSEVAFHEVGAWDSIADVVCAAHMIATMDVKSWSVGQLPLGRGTVNTAHGRLPVPAPATALLLRGYEFSDDGIEGERITPTGAAILKYLSPTQDNRARGMKLRTTGCGFGTRKFPGISNVVRVLVFDTTAGAGDWLEDDVVQLEFEIDDQAPEELAVALDRLRLQNGVLDLVQTSVYGKKGRQMLAIRVLVEPGLEEAIIRSCFDETTTLGIRRQVTRRSILRRAETVISLDGIDYRLKVAARPFGLTAKLEQEDALLLPGDRRSRLALRHTLEQEAITWYEHSDQSGKA